MLSHRRGVQQQEFEGSERNLRTAIEKNPHVLPLLFSWELTLRDKVFIQVGEAIEASEYEYIIDNTKYWLAVDGVLLEWMEEEYCRIKGQRLFSSNREVLTLLVKGTISMWDKDSGAAIKYFDRLMECLNEREDFALRARAVQRRDICPCRLRKLLMGLRDLDAAVLLCRSFDRDMQSKELNAWRLKWVPTLLDSTSRGGDPNSHSRTPSDDPRRGIIIDQSGHARKKSSVRNGSNAIRTGNTLVK
jgi:hypothetical protein